MQIDIQLLPFLPDPEVLSNRAVVVIDVLRATSVMVYAMFQGASEIVPVAAVEEAFRLVKTFPPGTTLLGGERGSRKIEGFDLGNSPREYVAEKVKGRRLILTTTNGTKAFHVVSSGREIMAGSFFNIGSVAQRCLMLGKDLLIFPSGDKGRFSLEDVVCGGMLIDLITQKGERQAALTDASYSARILYERFKKNVSEAFFLSHHGKDLADLGLRDDLFFCSQGDLTDIVPIFKGGVIRRQHAVGSMQ